MKLRQITVAIHLLLAFSSCSCKPEGWTSGKIPSASLTCSHLTFPAKNFYRNLEVHFQRDGEQVNVFLNVHSLPFEPDYEGMVMVTLETDEDSTSFLAPVLAGCQRVLLPPEAKELLLTALFEKSTVIISAGKYSTELNRKSFAEYFEQL